VSTVLVFASCWLLSVGGRSGGPAVPARRDGTWPNLIGHGALGCPVRRLIELSKSRMGLRGGSQIESEELTKKDSEALTFYARLADATRRSGSLGSAGKALLLAMELDPTNFRAAAAYGRLLHNDGHFDQAAQMYQLALLGQQTRSTQGNGSTCAQTALWAQNICTDSLLRSNQTEALAGLAVLLLSGGPLSHPLLQSPASPASSLQIEDTLQGSSLQPCQAEVSGSARDDEEKLEDLSRRLLARAISLSLSSPGCNDDMWDLISCTLEHSDESAAPVLVQGRVASALSAESRPEADIFLQCIQRQERRANQLLHEQARAIRAFRRLQNRQRRQAASLRRSDRGAGGGSRSPQTCPGSEDLCLCTHTDCTASRVCSHFGGKDAEPVHPANISPAPPPSRKRPRLESAPTAAGDRAPPHATDASPSQAAESHVAPEALSASDSLHGNRDALADCEEECELRAEEWVARARLGVLQGPLETHARNAAWLRCLYGDLLLRNGSVPAAQAHFAAALSVLPGFRPAMLRLVACACLLAVSGSHLSARSASAHARSGTRSPAQCALRASACRDAPCVHAVM